MKTTLFLACFSACVELDSVFVRIERDPETPCLCRDAGEKFYTSAYLDSGCGLYSWNQNDD